MINYVCALLLLFLGRLLADSLLFPPPFFSLFLLHIIQAHCALSPLFFLVPLQIATRYLSHTSRLLVSLLPRYTTRINRELPLESARLLESLIPKNLHYNLLIHLFKACFTPHESMHWVPSEFCLFLVALTS